MRLTAAELRAREPHLAVQVRSGLHVTDDLRLDPRRLTQNLADAVRQRGGKIVTGYAVGEVVVEGGAVRAVRTIDGEGQLHNVRCEVAVLAAGAWATASVRSPLTEARVRPVKGQIVRLRGPVLIQHALRTARVYLVPRDDGELIVGGTIEERGFDQQPTAGAVADLLYRAGAIVPAIGTLTISELSVGLRPALRDNLPVIGPVGAAGFYAAVGHFRSGILLAPATAHYLAEAIVGGSVPPELAALSVDRLAGGSVAAPLPGAKPAGAR
jgi:glycine oxidase